MFDHFELVTVEVSRGNFAIYLTVLSHSLYFSFLRILFDYRFAFPLHSVFHAALPSFSNSVLVWSAAHISFVTFHSFFK